MCHYSFEFVARWRVFHTFYIGRVAKLILTKLMGNFWFFKILHIILIVWPLDNRRSNQDSLLWFLRVNLLIYLSKLWGKPLFYILIRVMSRLVHYYCRYCARAYILRVLLIKVRTCLMFHIVEILRNYSVLALIDKGLILIWKVLLSLHVDWAGMLKRVVCLDDRLEVISFAWRFTFAK